jgi:hypothetical protein
MSAFTAPASVKGAAPRSILQGSTLRAALDARKAQNKTLGLEDAIAIVVPLCLDLKTRHDRGEQVFVHPSAVVEGPDGLACTHLKLATAPQNPRDRACLAPELQMKKQPGDARSSVFAVGAILYEAVTGHAIGPGMLRPRDVDASLPEALEVLLAKALVADPNHRPGDLGALASAMHHLAPMKGIHPPDVDASALDHAGELEVDVRLSMLPPHEVAPTQVPKSGPTPSFGDPFGNVVDKQAPVPSTRADATMLLAQLKARLESDPRPRYVVNKERMDHGPFTAVELLQQIASHTFTAKDGLRDELSGQQRGLADWEEFAPFIEHAARHREIKAEKAEVARVEKAEKKGGIAKFVFGLLITGAVAGIAAVVYFKIVRPARSDDIDVADDPVAFDLSIDAGVKGFARTTGQPRGAGGRGGRGGGKGGFSGGTSFESALDNNNETITMGGGPGQADLTNAQLAAPMQRLNVGACGAPDSMKVTVRVAVKMGRAVGVSVFTNPSDPGVASCIDRSVRGLSWPAHPKMDSFTTVY